jgi:hypothetical protein
VGSTAVLNIVKKKKYQYPAGYETMFLSFPANAYSLQRMRYPGSALLIKNFRIQEPLLFEMKLLSFYYLNLFYKPEATGRHSICHLVYR